MATLPPDYIPNAISLDSLTNSRLLHVSLYTGRAEIQRQFKFTVQPGQNQLCITGLPRVIQPESLRVQGHGDATLHDISLSASPLVPPVTTSPTLQDLVAKKNMLKSSIHRIKTSSLALEKYMHSMTVHDVPLDQVGSFLQSYNSHGSQLDEERAKLRKEEEELNEEIAQEKTRIVIERQRQSNSMLCMQVSIGLFAENEGEVELDLVYAVTSANWEAVYDIRVNLESKDSPVTLLYKAAITQNTGEDWTNVPLTLETATPSYGLVIPTLKSLKLAVKSHHHWAAPISYSTVVPLAGPGITPTTIAPSPVIITRSSRSRSRSRSPRSYRRRSRSLNSRSRSVSPAHAHVPVTLATPARLDTRELMVAPKAHKWFNHSVFQVPGLISVPCDNQAHNITIIELNKEIDAKLLWFAVPKMDTRVHLKAKIKNNSEYAFMSGPASVYVDGTFVARVAVPVSGPGESFDCSLGPDTSIKLTYHALSSKTTHRTPFTGFTGINSLSTFGTTKTTSTLYTQRVTVQNAKRISIDVLKLLDRVPVSEDERIKVKILKPAELNRRPPDANGVPQRGNEAQAQAHVLTQSMAPSEKGNGKGGSDSGSFMSSSKSGGRIGQRLSSMGKKRITFNPSSDRKSLDNSSTGVETVSPIGLETEAPTPPYSTTPFIGPTTTGRTRIVAQWDREDADTGFSLPPSDDSAPGNNNSTAKDSSAVIEELESSDDTGMMNWLLYDIPCQGTVNLVLEWEVSAASAVEVTIHESF
ncbi:hypothetical protein BDP27DRAFT_1413583 [Rhodocollybia butyracea]|uniref:Mucoidy inhibitor A n=1 Tax=Rhodocollybia butyracea TaxID=206335 RepID=A0A9P5UED2_9AGAR|nr:hypothetical protein BDP27DRAFT_1413583 [Rhodocollybia butyracea]